MIGGSWAGGLKAVSSGDSLQETVKFGPRAAEDTGIAPVRSTLDRAVFRLREDAARFRPCEIFHRRPRIVNFTKRLIIVPGCVEIGEHAINCQEHVHEVVRPGGGQ